jgi:hypothetical protein
MIVLLQPLRMGHHAMSMYMPCKYVMMAVATLLLAAAFVAGTFAVIGVSSFAENHKISIVDISAPCGSRPGFCPDPPPAIE